MKQTTILLLAVTILFFTAQIQPVHAETATAGASASLSLNNSVDEGQLQNEKQDNRAQLLRAYLEQYNSPLADEAETFVAEADKYNLDYRFLPAVAGVESWFGKRIPRNSYNAWGWGVYGGKVKRFASWEEGIQTISQDIRIRFMDKWGARNVAEIGRRYASDPKWTAKVMRFMREMEAFEENWEAKVISISL